MTIRKPSIHTLLTLALFAAMAACSHFIFLPQFFGLESAAFTYFGGDSTSQLIPAVSLLERNLLEGNIFWSWEYGLGGDLYSEFSYYYTTSPFFYLQFAIKALLDVAGSDFYTTQQWRLIFSIVKETLCMALMFALLRQEKHRWLFSVCGALIYGCSYWFIDNSFAFDFMTDAMIWPPLVIMTLNRFYRCGSWLPLLIAVALSIANSFYFGYINCIFYIVFAFVFSYRVDGIHAELRRALAEYAKIIGKLACITIGAACLAAIAFLPSVMALLDADRVQTATIFNWWPTLDFIKVIPEALFFKGAGYSYLDLQTFAFPIAIMLAAFINYRNASSATSKKTILAMLMLLFWLAPIMSSVMNGLSYPSNRWCYLVVFAVAYAFPNWMETTIEQKRLSALSVGTVAGLVILFAATSAWRTQNAMAETGYVFSGVYGSDILLFALGVAFVAALWLMQEYQIGRFTNIPFGETSINAAALGLFLCAMLLAMPYGPYAYVSGFRNNSGVEQFSDPEELALLFEGTVETRTAYEQIRPSSEEFYRAIDEESTRGHILNGHEARFENRSWISGSYPTSAYNSMVTEQVNQWLKLDYQVTSTTKSASQYRGLGNRLFMENAWGVAKKLNVTDHSQLYGYTDANDDGVWENSHALGIDLWYSSYATEDERASWSIAQKDAALLQAAAINTEEETSAIRETLTSASVGETVFNVPLSDENVELSNCTLSDELLAVGEDGEIRIALPNRAGDGEYLLSFGLVRNDGNSFTMLVNDAPYWSSAKNSRWGYPIDSYSIAVASTNSEIIISLDEGEYTLANAILEFNSYEQLEAWTESANLYSLENLQKENNLVKGTINNQTPGILALSIPFNEGWKCTVDDAEVDTFEVNGLFTGIFLEPGSHEVELTYRSKPFTMGLCVSTIAAAAIATAYAIDRRMRARKSPEQATGNVGA